MTMAAPHCSCDSVLPTFGPCPLHGTRATRDELVRLRECPDSLAIVEQAALEAREEIDRLRGVCGTAAEMLDGTRHGVDTSAVRALLSAGAASRRPLAMPEPVEEAQSKGPSLRFNPREEGKI